MSIDLSILADGAEIFGFIYHKLITLWDEYLETRTYFLATG